MIQAFLYIYLCSSYTHLSDIHKTSAPLPPPDPPSPPEVLGYTSGGVLRAGKTLALGCLARGGNPRPQVTWLRGGAPLEARLDMQAKVRHSRGCMKGY